MKKKILITGAGPNGITGNRIKEHLQQDYIILHPSSKELDLTSKEDVDLFFSSNEIDYIVHCAVVYPKINNDSVLQNLKMYFNLVRHCDKISKMFYIGSGAEYDKSRDIIDISEDEIGQCIPSDPYGLYKFIIQQHCSTSKNIYNVRLFGTINPLEPYSKNVISNLCLKVAKGLPLSLRKNCRFSFTDIDDVINFIKYGLENELKWHDYNCVPKHNYLLSEIAQEICRLTGNPFRLLFSEEGLNREYTASNRRIAKEFNDFTPLSVSLQKVYAEMSKIADSVEADDIDNRWQKK